MSLRMLSSASAELFTIVRYSRCSSESAGVERELGHADDAVQRRADLVAHVGEELALGLVRLLGDVGRGDELDGALAHLAIEILGERAQLGVEPLALDQRLFELPVRVGQARLHAVDVFEQRRDLRRRIRGQLGLGLAAVRRDVADHVDDFLERPRHAAREGAGAEHRAAEGQQHQSQREARSSRSTAAGC